MNIKLTPEQLAEGELSEDLLQIAAEQVRVNGYVVFEKLVGEEKVAELRAAFDPLFTEHTNRKGFNTGKRRAQMHLPFIAPFCDETIINHPIAVAVMEQVLGPNMKCIYFASDTALPGSEYQPVHSDVMPLYPELPVALPTYALVVNISLVETTELNGPLEVWPGGTHLNPDRANHDTLDGSVNPHLDIVRAAQYMHSEKVLAPAGSVVIRDIRMWHRGTPNRSASPRTNIAFVYTKDWYNGGYSIHIPTESYERMSARSRRLFHYAKRSERPVMPWEW